MENRKTTRFTTNHSIKGHYLNQLYDLLVQNGVISILTSINNEQTKTNAKDERNIKK